MERVLKEMSEEDRKELLVDLHRTDLEIPTAAIRRALAMLGVTISESAVRKYRNSLRDKGI